MSWHRTESETARDCSAFAGLVEFVVNRAYRDIHEARSWKTYAPTDYAGL